MKAASRDRKYAACFGAIFANALVTKVATDGIVLGEYQKCGLAADTWSLSWATTSTILFDDGDADSS